MKVTKDLRDEKMLAGLFHNNTKTNKAAENRKVNSYPKFPPREKIYSNKSYELNNFSKEPTEFYNLLKKRSSTVMHNVRTLISKEKVAKLLNFSYGLSDSKKDFHLLSVPSAGGRYPIYLYLFVFNIEGITKGIYLWQPEKSTLHMVKEGDYREDLKEVIYNPNKRNVERCSFAIVTTAKFSNTLLKYGDRGYRYILLDAGHVSQNLYLTSGSLEMTCRAVAGFADDKLAELIGIDKDDHGILLTHYFGTENMSIEKQLNLNIDTYLNEEQTYKDSEEE